MTYLEIIKQAAQRLKEARAKATAIKVPYIPKFSFGDSGTMQKVMQQMQAINKEKAINNALALELAAPFPDALIKLAEALKFYSDGAGLDLVDEGRNYFSHYVAYENDYEAQSHMDKKVGTRAQDVLREVAEQLKVLG